MTQLDFKISSGLKNIIGKELITNDLIAIFELVKNSFDANAKTVRIVFQNICKGNNKQARILIIDDGHGMSFDDIKNKFLFVGYSEKRDNEDFRDKIQKRRFFAGAKGIGRFSCDRLGSKLDMYTKKINEKNVHRINVDWHSFEIDQKKEFEIIHPKYDELKKLDIKDCYISEFKQGTILVINSLNDKWSWEKLIKLKRYLQRLINPVQVNTTQEFKIYLEAEEYKSDDKKYMRDEPWKVVNGVIKNFIFEDLGIKTTEINSEISEDGTKIITEVKDKGKFIFDLKEKNPFHKLDRIKTKVFYLNAAAKTAFTKSMGIEPIRYGSIFLYKNGIRIHPYGDEDDDWLGLERRKTQGIKRFLSSRELMGRIEIYGHQPNFTEVSSRDGGIVKNENYEELINYVVSKVVRRLERYVVEGIDWDKEESQKTEEQIKEDSLKIIKHIAGRGENTEVKYNPDLLGIVKKKEVEKIPELIKNLESINKHVTDKKVKDYAEKQIKSFRTAVDILNKEKKDIQIDLEVKQKESLFLSKAISTDTEALINLNHTIENSTLAIKDIISDINTKIKENRPINEISPLIDELSIETEKIKVLSGFVSLANFNMKTEWMNNGDIVQYITEYLQKIKTGTLRFKFINETLTYKTKFRPLEISIMLDNFISNSKKSKATLITFSFEVKDKNLHIYIADNGQGIETRHQKHIFNRGYTTTNGSGIGLHHIRNILETMNAEIEFIGNDHEGLGKGACFEMILK